MQSLIYLLSKVLYSYFFNYWLYSIRHKLFITGGSTRLNLCPALPFYYAFIGAFECDIACNSSYFSSY
ncbi:hypothetical protein H5410_006713 [Solanum commersonii]|uniref:Uncharacterized protein n=1 Tax=Solanum commersonii TaxID=4109 RepID=A0A9J6AC42_SOLCO|nr:hypothetical protein H5410_006713 [Solanum commersonii]